MVSACSNDYTKINDMLTSKPDYFPVCVNDFAPSDRCTRHHWIDKLGFPYRVMKMIYPYGNRLGTLTFVWKQISKYSTREMRRDFIEKHQRFATTSKSILRSIYHDLTDDSSSAPTAAQKAVDERVAKAVLSVGDPDVLIDLRN